MPLLVKVFLVLCVLLLAGGAAVFYFINKSKKPQQSKENINFCTITQSVLNHVEEWSGEVRNLPASKQILTVEDKQIPQTTKVVALCIDVSSLDPELDPLELAQVVCEDLGYQTKELSETHVREFVHLDMRIVVIFIMAYSEDYILKQVRGADLFNKVYSNIAVLYPKPKVLGKTVVPYDIIFNRIKGVTTTRDIRPPKQ